MNGAGTFRHLEKILYIVLGGVITTFFISFKQRLIDVPEYRIEAQIKAPLIKAVGQLVSEDTGKKYDLGDIEANPIEVRLMNTGKKPIERVEVVLEFVPTAGQFHLFDEGYAVEPKKGFGKVNISRPMNTERRIEFDLFNPGDVLTYFGIGNRPVTVIAYSRFPGLSFYQEYSPGKHDMLRGFVIGFIGFSACYGIFLFCFTQKKII